MHKDQSRPDQTSRRRRDRLASGARSRDGLLHFGGEWSLAAHELGLQLRNARIALPHLARECGCLAIARAWRRVLAFGLNCLAACFQLLHAGFGFLSAVAMRLLKCIGHATRRPVHARRQFRRRR